MTGYDDFETRLELALRRYGDQALLPFDPDLIAERAIGAPAARSTWRALLVPALLLGLLLAAAAAIATLTQPDPAPDPTPSGLGGLLRNPAGQGHAAAVLGDGRVFVLHGSWEGMGQSVQTTGEVWDPASGTSTDIAGEMTTERLHARALTLTDGRVLLVGGYGGPHAYPSSALASAEVWDPATGRFTPTGELTHARIGHTLSLLPDGRVLVAGGTGPDGGVVEAEMYDPGTGQFSAAGNLSTPRVAHTATVLSDGRVIVVGGRSLEGEDGEALASAEVWDPGSAAFEPAGDLASARAAHTATPLPGGRVLIVGGYVGAGYQTDGTGSRQPVIDPEPGFVDQFVVAAETWNPTAGFQPAGTLATPRTAHSTTLLADGRVAVIGGLAGDEEEGRVYISTLESVEIWDPVSERFTAGPGLTEPRADHTAVPLNDLTVMLIGGQAGNKQLTSVAVWNDEGAGEE